MIKDLIEFIELNWIDLSLIIVGASAIILYWVGERKKLSDKAALIVNQIDHLEYTKDNIKKIYDGEKLNLQEMYNSKLLFDVNYWEKYKLQFIRYLDRESFNQIDELYCNYNIIYEQQVLSKKMFENFFINKQNTINLLEQKEVLLNAIFLKNSNYSSLKEAISKLHKKNYTIYVPSQIGESLKRALIKINSITILENKGYKKLNKIAKRKL